MPCPGCSKIIQKIQKARCCGDIFEQDERKVREEYRKMAKLIHPDICLATGAAEAFGKLNLLYAKALDYLKKGTWDEWHVLKIQDGSSLESIPYITSGDFELGKWYVSDERMIFTFNEDQLKYKDRYAQTKKWIHYADRDMEKKYAVRMGIPEKIGWKEIILKKNKDDYPMGLFMNAMKGHLSGRNIAWMISRLADLCCFLSYNKIVLNGFCANNLLINPALHSIVIAGGWWYAVREGEKMVGTTREIFDFMPTAVRTSKTASFITDQESVKKIARELIACSSDIPDEIYKWANNGSSGNAITEYGRWNEALDRVYGKRTFVFLKADHDRIYKTEEMV